MSEAKKIKLVEKSVNVLFYETYTNPSGQMMDKSDLVHLRQKMDYIIADNTVLTSARYNPFDDNVDAVVISTSKHYSGGQHIGGCILFKNAQLHDTAVNIYVARGYHVSPQNCELICNSLKTMNQRIAKTSILAKQTIEYMLSNEKIEVKYTSLDSMPDVILFGIKGKKNRFSKNARKKLSIFNYKTSYGGPDSRIDPYPFEKDGLLWLRFSIGYKVDFCDIVRGLEEVMEII